MKFSLTPGPDRPLDRQTAWGCFTANQFALPGLGSLAAGRRMGYVQMALALAGLGLTSSFGIAFIVWFTSHSAELNNLQDQPDLYFDAVWVHLRGALLGFAVFLDGWLWALASSVSILSQAKRGAGPAPPPKIQP